MYEKSKYFGMGSTLKSIAIKSSQTSNFKSSASTFDKKIFKTISVIDTALVLIKYTAELFFNKAKLVQLLLLGNVSKLRHLPFIILGFYSYLEK